MLDTPVFIMIDCKIDFLQSGSKWKNFNIFHVFFKMMQGFCNANEGGNYLRLNEELGEEMPFDEIKFIDELIRLGEQVYKDRKEEIGEFLLS